MKSRELTGLVVLTSAILLISCAGPGGSGNSSPVPATTPDSATPPPASNSNSSSGPGFTLPSPNPVENAKKQSFSGITIDVPADWKALPKVSNGTASGLEFQSPGASTDAVKVYIGRNYAPQTGDLQTEYARMIKASPTSKVILREIDGTLGILTMSGPDEKYGDYLNWETFVPPDAQGYTVKRSVQFTCASGSLEKNKQKMVDILLSAKIQN